VLENLTEMLKGALEGCVLEIISRKETYGYEITRGLNALGFTDVVDGTVYTTLPSAKRLRCPQVTFSEMERLSSCARLHMIVMSNSPLLSKVKIFSF